MPMSKAQSGKRRVRRSLERWRQRESLCSGGKPDEIVFKGHAPVPCELLKHGRLHFTARFRFSRRTINFNPDQVSSIAHIFTSTNPSGNATARTTSSVTSVGTPRRSLWPGNPNCTGVRNFLAQDRQSISQFAVLPDENVDKSRLRPQAVRKG